MKRVIIESPYKGDVELNVRYARACIRDSILYGEAPIALHLLYTQEGVLDDNVPEEREWGISAGHVWRQMAERTVVYTDLGITDGMKAGIDNAYSVNRQVVFRTCRGWNGTDIRHGEALPNGQASEERK